VVIESVPGDNQRRRTRPGLLQSTILSRMDNVPKRCAVKFGNANLWIELSGLWQVLAV